MDINRRPYLLSAVVGQEKLKTAYLANIVNPSIGGLLISGPKGTGKSTIVHAVGTILPDYDAVEGCDFNCDPARPRRFCTQCRERAEIKSIRKNMRIVNLPLSCTEDRLIGSVDVETLLKTGQKKVQVGILGEAHRNILYVDEVNLLPDHLVDDILDAAASPWNTIEREGISITHPAEFVLVGTMNPEEGELRPQILDRFPLCANVTSIFDVRLRSEIVKRNLLFENDPDRFHDTFEKDERAYRDIILRARRLLPDVTIRQKLILGIAEACATLKVDGQRPDIVIVKTSLTIAALEDRRSVSPEDILLAAELALCHRTRDGGLLEPPTLEDIQTTLVKAFKNQGAVEIVEDAGAVVSGSDVKVDRDIDRFMTRSADKSGKSETSNGDSSAKKKR